MYGYIYKTTNLLNGKIYIGRKISNKFRPRYKGSGTILNLAFKKHGWDNFKVEFLIPCFSYEELCDEERFLIAYFNARDRNVGYNRAEGGEGGIGGPMFRGHRHSEETKLKMSRSQSGKKRSFETRAKLSESVSKGRLGIKYSEEGKAKLSEAFLGDRNPFYGKHHSEATRKHWSEIRKGQSRTYHFVCTECGRESIGHSSRQHICSECRTRIQTERESKVYKKQYRKICKICGHEFLGNSPKSNMCPSCKKGGGL